MHIQTKTLTKKLRVKFIDHLDSFMLAELITERFHGPFLSLRDIEQAIDQRARSTKIKKRS